MRGVFVLLLSLTCLVFAITIDQDGEPYQQFVAFQVAYNKQYTAEEHDIRFSNFQESLKRIEAKNRVSRGAVYGVTKFSDLTPLEFKQRHLLNPGITVNKKADNVRSTPPRTNVALPDKIDWRTKNCVTPVKNQEQCGSCWAFSVTEAIESFWILAKNASVDTLRLAPQQIVDCDDSDLGCNGGNPPTAYEYVINAGGLEPEADYPYKAANGKCSFDKSKVVASIKSWEYATSWYSETTLQENLVSKGPLSVCVDASNWQDYKSGVMTHDQCAWINVLDHCVQLVGYDKTGSTNYYMVRNSWGPDWGVDGYIHLEMDEDTCGIANEATYPVI